MTDRELLLRRARKLVETRIRMDAARDKLNVAKTCFAPQMKFVRDVARFKTAVCTRRAGKTEGAAIELLDVAERKPGAPVLYFTLTRSDAKRLMWDKLKELNRKFGLGYEPNESDLVLKKNGKGIVYLTGVNTKAEIEKMRGSPWAKAIGDEAQALPEYVRDLVEEVLTPAFMDYNGTLTLIGTPGPVPAGYFYDVAHSDLWSHHMWTVWDNPHVPDPRRLLDDILAMRGVTEDDPKIQREWFGKWTLDLNSLVFKYDAVKNAYTELPSGGDWCYVIGVDVGFNDADAIAVLGWQPTSHKTWLVEEHIEDKADVTKLATNIRAVWDRLGHDNVMAIVMDAGALGKKIGAELSARFRLPVVAAQKSEKQMHIELLNDALRTGNFFARRDSRFAQDSKKVEWDSSRATPERRVISDRYHSDICDSVLYAFRESLAWLSKIPVLRPAVGTPEAFNEAARELFEKTQREVIAAKEAEEFDLGPGGFEGWGVEP